MASRRAVLPFGAVSNMLALEVFHAIGKGASQFGTFIETDQEKFILRVRGFEELHGSFASLVYFIGHAAAVIEDDSDGNGYVLGGKGNDFLLGTVFEDAEVVLVESCYQSIKWICYGYVYEGQVDIASDYSTRTILTAGVSLFTLETLGGGEGISVLPKSLG